MSNIDELPDLAGDVRERAVPPPYEQVTRRVRARRLRAVTGTLAGTALAVGGLAVWQSIATTASPDPAPPITQPADPAYPASPAWRQVVDGTGAHPFQTQGTDDGSIAAVWRALELPEPTFALVIREADGTVHGRRLDAPVSLTPVPGGWVGLRTGRAWFISSAGTWTDLGQPGPSRESRPGDVLVLGQYGITMLYSPSDNTLSSLPQPYGDVDGGYVTPDGDLVTCGLGQGGVRASSDTVAIVTPAVPGTTCVMAGYGDDFAVVGLGDDADGGKPMTGLFLWMGNAAVLPRTTSLLDGVTSVVMTADGATVITDASTGDWHLIGADGTFRPVDRKVGEAFVAGDRLYVSSYGFMDGPLFFSDDAGRTWTETTLPGRE